MNLRGQLVDEQTRCVHYHTAKDIIAIKMKCCHTYYPCYQCHEEEADHPITRWTKMEWDEKAILCGRCHEELSIATYLAHDTCPHCHAAWNPRCEGHYHLYFEMEE
ncbi:CHY zinc finger protein [Kurthia populi]|uniref:CHY zinc finger protein n=1 Tax=Kurthia populi TaxID=1562132 RepID=A0ABW5Y4V8_9BACL